LSSKWMCMSSSSSKIPLLRMTTLLLSLATISYGRDSSTPFPSQSQ
jgi:hypothetical protein